MAKHYVYVGGSKIAEQTARKPKGTEIASARDFLGWAKATNQEPDPDGGIVTTFVIDTSGNLRVADRHSEHVACAGGDSVLSAGEMTFLCVVDNVEVTDVSNQSAGYCPEPESWPSVAAALDRAGIPHPGRFTREVVFRRCTSCGQKNIVKDDWFECGVCGAELPQDWNFPAS